MIIGKVHLNLFIKETDAFWCSTGEYFNLLQVAFLESLFISNALQILTQKRENPKMAGSKYDALTYPIEREEKHLKQHTIHKQTL